MKSMGKKNMGLLSPYRVLDLCDEKGVMCGRILGDFGADVIKVERPGGDRCRNIGPFYHDIAHPEKSLFWFAYCANKRGITLNIESADGREIFRKLVKTADVVVESFPPGYMDSLGLGYTEFLRVNPGLIMTSITPFGQTGPYKHFKGPDLVTWSIGGMTQVSGSPNRPPLRVSFPQSYPHGGAVGAVGTIFALYYRTVSGEGQYVDVSIQEQVVRILCNVRQFWDVCHINLSRAGQHRIGLSAASNNRLIWQCKDGYVSFNTAFSAGPGGRSNQALVDWMNSEGIKDDYLNSIDWSRYSVAQTTEEQFARMEIPISKFFMKHTMTELFEGAIERRAMIYPAYSAKEIAEDTQLRDREFLQELEHPEIGETITYPGAFVKLSATESGLSRRAPLIGEHNKEVYAELGLSDKDLLILKQSGVI
jgi:benzylsuccinate CoA-transferase BbsE subunit/naphthyl-2-methylsuccinate CoA transferase subunit